jgi:molybdopterin-guanine dinucleotide biosynthesis protein A
MLVTAPGREHPPGWRRFDLEAVDPESGGGPLRGVLTALEHLTTPYLLILTVDMPAVRAAQSDRVLACVKSDPKNLGAMMSRLVDGQPRIEPFPCAMRIEARPVIAARLARNRRSIHGLLDEPGFDVLPAPADWNDDVWMNLNFPDDTAKLERR